MNTLARFHLGLPARPLLYLAAFAAALHPAGWTWGAFASLSRQSRPVTAAEVLGGAPVGGFVHEFFVTSDTDVLSASWINIDAPLYQNPLGSDVAPPSLGIATLSPALTADSFISMPGSSTFIAGGGFGAANAAWGDTTNDGPQANHLFARLTTNQTGTFSGRIALRGLETYHSLPFEFLLPGNASDFDLLASEPTYSLEYSLDPPPPPPEPIEVLPVAPPPPIDVELPAPQPAPEPPIETPPMELPAAPEPAPTPQPEPAPITPPAPVEIVQPEIPTVIDLIGFPLPAIRPIIGDLTLILRSDLLRNRILEVEAVAGGLIPLETPVEYAYYMLGTSSDAHSLSIGEWSPGLHLDGAMLSARSLTASALGVSQDAGIPEPAAIVLALGGLLALIWNRRLPLFDGK